MNHFILTRFNVRLYPKDKNGHVTLTPEWLEHRFLLFELYTLPCLSAQTCKDFKYYRACHTFVVQYPIK